MKASVAAKTVLQSVILGNLTLINQFKTSSDCYRALNVNRKSDYDNFLLKLDHSFTEHEYMFLRYFFNDGRLTNVRRSMTALTAVRI